MKQRLGDDKECATLSVQRCVARDRIERHRTDLKTICFLDIDGILHPTSNDIPIEFEQRFDIVARLVRGELDPKYLGVLMEDKQALLADILREYEDIDIVISSAWRYMRPYYRYHDWDDDNDIDFIVEVRPPQPDHDWMEQNITNLKWLKSLLHPVIAERIVGKTPGGGKTRLDEVRAFIRNVDPSIYSGRWVAIDDQERHFPRCVIPHFFNEYEQAFTVNSAAGCGEVVVLINGDQGLNARSAAAVRAAFSEASLPDVFNWLRF